MGGLGIGLQSAGIGLSMLAAYKRNQAAQSTLKLNAKLAQRNAEQDALSLERQATILTNARHREAEALVFDLSTFDRLTTQALSATHAAIGASGTEFSGSNLLIAAEQAQELALQRSVLTFASEQRQADLEDEAALVSFQASETRVSGEFSRDALQAQRTNVRRGLPLELSAIALGGSAGLLTSAAAQRGTRRPRRPRDAGGAP